MYFKVLSFGINDPIFHAKNFGKIPVAILHGALERLSKYENQTINAYSISTAKLGCLVYGALGGKTNKISIADFLPFEMPRAEKELKPSTIAAMKWALKHEKLPPAIIGMIGAELA